MVLVHFPRDQCVLTPNRALNRTQFSQAKVENIRVATFCHKDVRRFDVTVDYAFRMSASNPSATSIPIVRSRP